LGRCSRLQVKAVDVAGAAVLDDEDARPLAAPARRAGGQQLRELQPHQSQAPKPDQVSPADAVVLPVVHQAPPRLPGPRPITSILTRHRIITIPNGTRQIRKTSLKPQQKAARWLAARILILNLALFCDRARQPRSGRDSIAQGAAKRSPGYAANKAPSPNGA